MYFFVFFLSFRQYYEINTYQDATLLNDFGFHQFGIFNVTFTNIQTKTLFYALLTESEFPVEMMLAAQAEKFCNGVPPIPKIQYSIPQNNDFSIYGLVETEGVYTPILYNCANEPIVVNVNQIFRNPKNFMDSRWDNTEYSQVICIVYATCLLFYWIVNWFMNFRWKLKIHYFVTTTMIFSLAYIITSLFETNTLKTVDEAPLETILRTIYSILSTACLFITLLLASKGWCIYKAELTFKDIFLSVVYVVIYNTFAVMHSLGFSSRFNIIWSIISLIALTLFLRELIISTNHSKLHFTAYLYVISNAGILPDSTPVYAKYKLYKLLKYSVFACFVYIIIQVCVEIFANPFFWVDRFLLDVLQFGMATILCIIFRLKKEQSQDQYMRLENQGDAQDYEDAPPDVLSLNDVEQIDLKALLKKPGVVWTEGMKLPVAPIIKKTMLKHSDIADSTFRRFQQSSGENEDGAQIGNEQTERNSNEMELEDL